MLYPLSYEGASAQPTCQRIPTSTQEWSPAPTAVADSLGDDFGRRRVFRAGLALLAASTVGAAASGE
ncbi:hypothetical protein GCE86_28655 [Micromonospora terminaliae]|uniref:MFS transporter n=1 Tax=Micromonospora terminaliae TaxID=1914461 RepID=A0AAJ2ZB61_9ACTN|nr:hypothetical protein [Micromonospora terminaliae]NES26473.1 MFS transporter [Micromonospora terminaliae]QGL50647.1 hypothetical protein GCE86_28655 [Micromonospora terminaliae]